MNTENIALSPKLRRNLEEWDCPPEALRFLEKMWPLPQEKKGFFAQVPVGVKRWLLTVLSVVSGLCRDEPNGCVRGLIVTATRVETLEILGLFEALSKRTGLRAMGVWERQKKLAQQEALLSEGLVDVVVGTAARIHELEKRRVVRLGDVEILAVEDLSAFEHFRQREHIAAIDAAMPDFCRRLFFTTSAPGELSGGLGSIVRSLQPVFSPQEAAGGPESLFEAVEEEKRLEALTAKIGQGTSSLVLVETPQMADFMAEELRTRQIKALSLQKNAGSADGFLTYNVFWRGAVEVLVATTEKLREFDWFFVSHIICYRFHELRSCVFSEDFAPLKERCVTLISESEMPEFLAASASWGRIPAIGNDRDLAFARPYAVETPVPGEKPEAAGTGLPEEAPSLSVPEEEAGQASEPVSAEQKEPSGIQETLTLFGSGEIWDVSSEEGIPGACSASEPKSAGGGEEPALQAAEFPDEQAPAGSSGGGLEAEAETPDKTSKDAGVVPDEGELDEEDDDDEDLQALIDGRVDAWGEELCADEETDGDSQAPEAPYDPANDAEEAPRRRTLTIRAGYVPSEARPQTGEVVVISEPLSSSSLARRNAESRSATAVERMTHHMAAESRRGSRRLKASLPMDVPDGAGFRGRKRKDAEGRRPRKEHPSFHPLLPNLPYPESDAPEGLKKIYFACLIHAREVEKAKKHPRVSPQVQLLEKTIEKLERLRERAETQLQGARSRVTEMTAMQDVQRQRLVKSMRAGFERRKHQTEAGQAVLDEAASRELEPALFPAEAAGQGEGREASSEPAVRPHRYSMDDISGLGSDASEEEVNERISQLANERLSRTKFGRKVANVMESEKQLSEKVARMEEELSQKRSDLEKEQKKAFVDAKETKALRRIERMKRDYADAVPESLREAYGITDEVLEAHENWQRRRAEQKLSGQTTAAAKNRLPARGLPEDSGDDNFGNSIHYRASKKSSPKARRTAVPSPFETSYGTYAPDTYGALSLPQSMPGTDNSVYGTTFGSTLASPALPMQIAPHENRRTGSRGPAKKGAKNSARGVPGRPSAKKTGPRAEKQGAPRAPRGPRKPRREGNGS